MSTWQSAVESFSLSTDYNTMNAFAPVVLSPENGAALPGATPPIFAIQTNFNVKFSLDISTTSGFLAGQTKSFTFTTPNPNVQTELLKTLSKSQWTSVKTLIGLGTGWFRVRGSDGIKRESDSTPESFTITP